MRFPIRDWICDFCSQDYIVNIDEFCSFLQPKWNNALLEMFRIDYVGRSPYINCLPSLYHHRLGPKDRFLILSSDGLYQYFTNEEAVSEVELFIALQPEGDPAQHLVELLLFRAAKRAGTQHPHPKILLFSHHSEIKKTDIFRFPINSVMTIIYRYGFP